MCTYNPFSEESKKVDSQIGERGILRVVSKRLPRPNALTVSNIGQTASSVAFVGLVRYLQSTRND